MRERVGHGYPGKPVSSQAPAIAYRAFAQHIEVSNIPLRAERLNEHWFLSLEDVQAKIETWRIEYDEARPHGSRGSRTPED